MNRTLAAAIAAITLSFALLAAGPTAPAQARGCPNSFGGDVVNVTNVSCRRTRSVIRNWALRARRTKRANRTVLGFRCRGTNSSVEGLVMRCRRGSATIRFYANVPPARR